MCKPLGKCYNLPYYHYFLYTHYSCCFFQLCVLFCKSTFSRTYHNTGGSDTDSFGDLRLFGYPNSWDGEVKTGH